MRLLHKETYWLNLLVEQMLFHFLISKFHILVEKVDRVHSKVGKSHGFYVDVKQTPRFYEKNHANPVVLLGGLTNSNKILNAFACPNMQGLRPRLL